MGKPVPIRDRIALALKGGPLNYWDLARAVFPEADFPRAWRYPTRGGPPGCLMALSSALRRHGFRIDYQAAGRRIVHPLPQGEQEHG